MPATLPQTPADANVFSHPLGIQPPSEPAAPPEANVFAAEQSADFKGEYEQPFNGYEQAAPQPPASEKGEHSMIQPNLEAYNAIPEPGLKSSGVTQAEGRSAIGGDHDLPPYDLLYSLVDIYFKHINTWCPILQRKNTIDALFGRGGLDDGDRALLHAIVVTTMRFSADARLTRAKRSHYHSLSKQKVLLYGLETSSVKSLQALVILALDLCGESNGPPGWNLLAVITRAAVQLGLSVETTSQLVAPRHPSIYTLRELVLPEPANFIEEESRRRLFWMVYILDRYATIITAFDFAMDEKEIDRKLPCRDDMFAKNQFVETRWFRREEKQDPGQDKPEHLGSFSYYVEVIGILSRIHRFLKRPVDITALPDVERWQTEYRQLDQQLETWKTALPKEYGNISRLFDSNSGNKIVNCGWVMLQATYFTTTIRLHSSAAYPSNRSTLFNPSLSASTKCQEAVHQIMALCGHVNSAGLLNKLGPPFAFSLWVAARLMLVHSATVDHQINPKIDHFVETLRRMGQYWAVADRYASVLQRVLDEFAESERDPNAGANGERETPKTLRILTDMRRCAYDLDTMISSQPYRQSAAAAPARGATPSRTPAPNELEYLDVFDFFNMPRLPVPNESSAVGISVEDANKAMAYDPRLDWLR